ncbi:hypothetical protein [Peribacillus sp. FSL E2-0218]|uniref:hypothetical protein n=1 Tax=Peribacillus sp. FSL E2-0218 TaxID=2921364 RepID=UPI0030EEB0DE
MRKALVKDPSNGEKVEASTYFIKVHHKSGKIIPLEVDRYTYEDVFEYIKEEYSHDMDYIQSISIEVKS